MAKKVYAVYRNGNKLLETSDIDLAQLLAKTVYDYDCNFSDNPYQHVSVMQLKRETSVKTICRWSGYNGD